MPTAKFTSVYLSTQPHKGICSLGCSYSLCLTSRLDKTFISSQKPCVKNFFHHFQKFLVEEVGLEPTKPFRAADLQSAAIATMRPFHEWYPRTDLNRDFAFIRCSPDYKAGVRTIERQRFEIYGPSCWI